MVRFKKIFFIFLFCLAFQFLPLISVSAVGASLYLMPGSFSFNVGQTKNVSLILNSGGQAVNSSQATINFPTDKLSVTKISRGGLFTFWPVEPNFSNSAGTISYAGGLPDPGYSGSGATILTITFKAKAEGVAKVTIGGASILANDGKGTNVLGGTGSGTFTIIASTPTTEKPEKPSATPTTTPAEIKPINKAVIAISSKTHPDFNTWYQSGDLELIWSRPVGITKFSYILDQTAETIPDTTPDEDTLEQKYPQLASGVWYFHVSGFDGRAWSQTSHFKVQIDHDLPQDVEISSKDAPITYRQDPEVILKAKDLHSGIDSYEISVDKKNLGKISDGEELQYQLPELDFGKHIIKMIVRDKAGNQVEKTLNLEVLRSQPILGFGRFDLMSFLIGVISTILIFGLGFILGRRAKKMHKRR